MAIKPLITYWLIGIIPAFLFACSGGEQPEEQQESVEVAEKKSGGGVIPKYQMDALNRAKDVEAMLLETDEKRRKQLEEMQ